MWILRLIPVLKVVRLNRTGVTEKSLDNQLIVEGFLFIVPYGTRLKWVDLPHIVDSCWLIVGGKINT